MLATGLLLLAVPVWFLVQMSSSTDPSTSLNSTASFFLLGVPCALIGLVMVLMGLARKSKSPDSK